MQDRLDLRYAGGRPKAVLELLGRRSDGGLPNISDAGGRGSIRLAEAFFEALSIPVDHVAEPDPGPKLESRVGDWLRHALSDLDGSRRWAVGCQSIDAFVQYDHLGRLQEVVRREPTLRAEIGGDYLVAPDVTVGIDLPRGGRFLHACVSCKWTLRSDRAQNVRHEAVILTRHRRGRQPHIVAVTAEPMPTRLASLARGTGEVDAVYHLALPELEEAVEAVGGAQQIEALEELTSQGRLRDLLELPETLLL